MVGYGLNIWKSLMVQPIGVFNLWVFVVERLTQRLNIDIVVSVLNDYFPQTPQCLSQHEKHFFLNEEEEVTVDLSARSATECIKHAEASETQGVSGGLSTFFGVFFFLDTVMIYLHYISSMFLKCINSLQAFLMY